MMNEIDYALRGAIREMVDDVDVDAGLAAGAIAAGRRTRSRRRYSVLAAAVAVALAGTGGVVVTAKPQSERTLAAVRTTTLPPASEHPGAAVRPEALGSDPAILHFDLDRSALGDNTWVSWFINDGTESAMLLGSRSTGLAGTIAVTHRAPPPMTTPIEPDGQVAGTIERRQTTVNGLPATMERLVLNGNTTPQDGPPSWDLTWQPADGVWVRLHARERDFGTLAGAIRLDRAQRCVTPMLVTVPPGSRLTGCDIQTGAGSSPWSHAGFTFVDPGDQPHRVALGLPKSPADFTSADLGGLSPRMALLLSGPPDFVQNRTVLGKPAMWKDGTLTIQGFHEALNLSLTGQYEAAVTSLALGLRIVPDLTAWDTWPQRPF